MPALVDPADGEYERMDRRSQALRDELCRAPDRAGRRTINRELRQARRLSKRRRLRRFRLWARPTTW